MLVELIGPVDPITTVDQLPTRFNLEQRPVASGVVPRLKLPEGLRPLKIKPQLDADRPYFAKLRAEATGDLLREGSGQLYLGIHLDPLYEVHWNNRAGKVTLTIESPEGIAVTPSEVSSPDVAEDADVDPREFLVEVNGDVEDQVLRVTVAYVACDDAQTFCDPVTQQYDVTFEPTRDLGSRPGVFMPAMFAGVREHDQNGDGDITADELPAGSVSLYIGHLDYDGDEVIERDEIETFLRMFNNGRGFDSALNDGDEAGRD